MRVLVVGGGIFGCTVAAELAEADYDVTLVEKNPELMMQASRVNHNRVHFGYHYPRSTSTANQCVKSLSSFLMHYGKAVVSDFPNYYAIASEGSYVTPKQFTDFCDEVGIDYREEAPPKDLLSPGTIQASYRVREPIFDYDALKLAVVDRVSKSGASLAMGTTIHKTTVSSRGGYKVDIGSGYERFDKVINCSYSGLNVINKAFGVRPRELRFERTMVPIFSFEHPKVGLTVMDGPFCTIMPHGKKQNEFLLWHVDGCVLDSGSDVSNIQDAPPSQGQIERAFDISRKFMPFMSRVEHIRTQHTIKTVHENKYDARVSEVIIDDEHPDYISILSGKLMCAPRIAYQVRNLLSGGDPNREVVL